MHQPPNHITAQLLHTGWASLKDLNRYQWLVFAVAAIAWLADCMDQQIFNLARMMSISDLVGDVPEKHHLITTWATRATSAFLVGWAIGGLIFGMIGDRIGRVRTLTITVLMYSILTGLSAASRNVWDYTLYRLLTGVGVGGVFAAAVSLIIETMPAHARPYSLSLMQAMSTVGNCAAAVLYIGLGLIDYRPGGLAPWRLMFLIGIVPALLAVIIQRWLHEPQSWIQAKVLATIDATKRLGSYRQLFVDSTLRRHAILGMVLSSAGVIGLWGIAFFSVDLQQRVFETVYHIEAQTLNLRPSEMTGYVARQRIIWAGVTSLLLNIGGFFGMTAFGWCAVKFGRRPVFAVSFFASAASVAMLFLGLRSKSDILWMTPLMGFCALAPFGGYAIYLPELFPTRLRATGTSFCYNVGRFVAATGPLTLGFLTINVFGQYGHLEPDLPARYAGVAMCTVFALGLAALPFLPETRDKPLPE